MLHSLLSMPSLFFTLTLGFILGIKHAFEPDHVIAVSTIAVDQKNPFKSALLGTFWGIGHTTTLLLTGILVLLLKLSVPANLIMSFELLVGVMLIFLGFRTLKQNPLTPHSTPSHRKHHTSFLIGVVHGLAGSGALMLLVLSTIPSFFQGIYYILLFGLGSASGMTAMSFLLSLPLLLSANKFPSMEKYLRLFTGILSILFGLFLVYQIGSNL